MQLFLSRAMAVATLIAIVGCGGDGGTPPVSVSTVEVTLATPTVLTGATTQATAAVKDASGNVLTGRTITWSSSSATVATVVGSGGTATVTAVAPGTATITATSEGRTANATVTVLAPVASVTVVLGAASIASNGTTQATVTPRDGSGNALTGRTVTFASANQAVATVSSTGAITAVGPGTSNITATSEGQSGSATVTVCVAGIAPSNTGTNIYVAVASGNDATGTGTCAAPYKTITKGVAGRVAGTSVRVSPGTYNAVAGETFPIMLPQGVALIGDEANKGQGATATKVIGGGNIALTGACGTFGTTIYAGAQSAIAGFELTNGLGTFAQMTLLVRTDGVTIRNNSVVNNNGNGIHICNSSVNQVITGNRIRGNNLGLGFIFGGVGAKVEDNVITNNAYGVEYDAPGGDLGGGSTGSIGGNTIACNTANDVWTNLGGASTINAANNFWDHTPLSGNDLFNPNGAIVVTTGAQLAATRCP